MGRRKQEDLEWLMHSNPSPQPSPNGLRSIPLPENHHRFSLASPRENTVSVNGLSSLPLSRSLQLPLPDFGPHCPNPANTIHALHNTNNSSSNNVFINPSYPDSSSFYDVLLENKFSQLNLSSPGHQSSANPSIGRFGSMPSASNNNFSYVDHNSFGNAQFSSVSYPATQYMNGSSNSSDLQRMRVDSAVRGQTGGLYIPPHGGGYITAASSVVNDDGVLNGTYQGLDNLRLRHQGFPWPNRDGAVFHPEVGYFFPDKNSSGRNGDIRERSFDTISSSSSSFDRSRQQQQRQNFASLEELRSKIFSSLEELRGKIFIVAKDQNGCRDLQKILGEGKPEEKDMIFSELKNHVRELMVDQFANYLAQKMFEVGNEEQITELLLLVINDEDNLMAICLDMHGTRAMQKLLGNLTTSKQRSLVISALRRITVTLTKSTNGHHVVEHCLKHFPNEDKMYILRVVADNCLGIATDKSGCCVLQQCVEHARGEPRDRLVSEIIANALVLSEHPYGNYVVQFLVGLRIPHITSDILAQLAGNYVSLSMNKYGSNVVEKCMKESSEEQAMKIIQEIIGSQNFLTVLQDPFGNYVAQSACSLAKGSIRHAMMNLIQMHYSYLHSHPHGKRVLARARGSRQRV